MVESQHGALREEGFCPTSFEHLERLRRSAVKNHTPISGSFDITHRCNLRCTHCYLGDHSKDHGLSSAEMAPDQIHALLSEAVDAGCLYLLISGGEPLLRNDFEEVYRRAKKLGLLITVFTNATLVAEHHIDLFREYPPLLVEVTLYGATEGTYEKITRVPGSYDRCLAGIYGLIRAGIRVGLKTMVLRSNAHEIEAIEDKAAVLGVPFRLDAALTPCLDCSQGPLLERVDPLTVAAIEFRSSKRRNRYKEYFERASAYSPNGKLFHCGAGVTSFHLDPSGVLRPCFMAPELTTHPLQIGLAEAWKQTTITIAGLYSNDGNACIGCSKKAICGYCPGLFLLENGDMEKPSHYICQLGEARLFFLQELNNTGGET